MMPTSISPVQVWMSLSVRTVQVYSTLLSSEDVARKRLKDYLPPSVVLSQDPIYGDEYALYRGDGVMCDADYILSPGTYFLATNLLKHDAKTVVSKLSLGLSNDGTMMMDEVMYSDGSVETVTVPLFQVPLSNYDPLLSSVCASNVTIGDWKDFDFTQPLSGSGSALHPVVSGTGEVPPSTPAPVETVTGSSKGSSAVIACSSNFTSGDWTDFEFVQPVAGVGFYRRRPRATRLFDIDDMPREQWVWMVEFRRKMTVHGPDGEQGSVWSSYSMPRQLSPCGFRTREAACQRLLDVMELDSHNIDIGLVEYTVAPYYLGYPPDDLPWFRETYTRQSSPAQN